MRPIPITKNPTMMDHFFIIVLIIGMTDVSAENLILDYSLKHHRIIYLGLIKHFTLGMIAETVKLHIIQAVIQYLLVIKMS